MRLSRSTWSSKNLSPTLCPYRRQCVHFEFMALEVIEISDKHRDLLQRLVELIPDLDPDAPQSMQRIFGLGLIALTLQITNKAKAQQQDELVEELGLLAREMVEAEDTPNNPEQS